MNQSNQEIRENLSTLERPLTFNEWSEKFNVSSRYVEPTKYFKGNPSSGFPPLEVESPIRRLINYLMGQD
jgi:hypothetical protein